MTDRERPSKRKKKGSERTNLGRGEGSARGGSEREIERGRDRT